MDDLQFWLYIIIAVVYVITRLRKQSKQATKRRPPMPRPATPEREESETAQPQMTFEEMLREITEAKTARELPGEQPRTLEPETKYVDYDDDIETYEEKKAEDTGFDYRKEYKESYKIYEDAKQEAFKRPSLEEMLAKRPAEQPMIGRFKPFEVSPENRIFNEYIKELHDPEGFKKALILSELINRRYF